MPGSVLNNSGAEPPADDVLAASIPKVRSTGLWPPCPVNRMPRRRRNQICIAIIALGLANYLVYTLTYAALGGDAHNGQREIRQLDDGTREVVYKVRGHFIRSPSGHERVISRGAWIYSYVHSISLPLTSGAMIISMLLLARPHILATMRGGWISGRTLVTVFGTIVVLITGGAAILFTWSFISELRVAHC
ncbi:MAG: hypothetical protein KAY37_14910 [Phycisphaerae bacterium]|nr:hypothetical protein [Phycisphaerae bacterium]